MIHIGMNSRTCNVIVSFKICGNHFVGYSTNLEQLPNSEVIVISLHISETANNEFANKEG
jgi:hypothetical protein